MEDGRIVMLKITAVTSLMIQWGSTNNQTGLYSMHSLLSLTIDKMPLLREFVLPTHVIGTPSTLKFILTVIAYYPRPG
jgi:hypothetical protein